MEIVHFLVSLCLRKSPKNFYFFHYKCGTYNKIHSYVQMFFWLYAKYSFYRFNVLGTSLAELPLTSFTSFLAIFKCKRFKWIFFKCLIIMVQATHKVPYIAKESNFHFRRHTISDKILKTTNAMRLFKNWFRIPLFKIFSIIVILKLLLLNGWRFTKWKLFVIDRDKYSWKMERRSPLNLRNFTSTSISFIFLQERPFIIQNLFNCLIKESFRELVINLSLNFLKSLLLLIQIEKHYRLTKTRGNVID